MPDWGSIEFKWPFMLWAMTLWPLWLVWRAWRHRRSQRMASSWQTGSPTPIGLLFIEALSLALLLLALARPQAVLLQAMRDAAVILVIDSSASMKADDVSPNRLDAARNAARHFIETKPGLLQVGIVAVGGTAMLTQVPTLQREDLTRALDELSWQNGSALGTGVLIALDTLLPQAGIDPQTWLATPSYSTALANVVKRLLKHADRLYDDAELATAHLPWRCRPAIVAASRVYAEIGRELERRSFDSVNQRTVVASSKKWQLVFYALTQGLKPSHRSLSTQRAELTGLRQAVRPVIEHLLRSGDADWEATKPRKASGIERLAVVFERLDALDREQRAKQHPGFRTIT